MSTKKGTRRAKLAPPVARSATVDASPAVARDAERARANILAVATEEFARKGLSGARVDEIAARTHTVKRMIYYYFGSKEGLYLSALESVFEKLVALENEIEVEHLEPAAAIEAMINLKIDYYLENPHFVSFLAMENFHKARHLRKSRKLDMFKTPLTDVIARILKRGQRSGQFRRDVEPVDFYVSICALCIMYFSNQHSLGVIFEREMTSPASIARRKRTVVEFVLSYLQNSDVVAMQPARRGPARHASLVS
jgi:AcrR family transcriptional regulator